MIVAEIGDGNDVYFGGAGDADSGVDTLDISAATADVLKPADPLHPHVTTAADFLRQIVGVEQSLARGVVKKPVAASA